VGPFFRWPSSADRCPQFAVNPLSAGRYPQSAIGVTRTRPVNQENRVIRVPFGQERSARSAPCSQKEIREIRVPLPKKEIRVIRVP